jgi:hypothetical protein
MIHIYNHIMFSGEAIVPIVEAEESIKRRQAHEQLAR